MHDKSAAVGLHVARLFRLQENVATESGGGAFVEDALSSGIGGNFTMNAASLGGGMYLTDSESVEVDFARKPGMGFRCC